MGIDHSIMRSMYTKAKHNPKKVVFSDANDVNVLQAAIQIKQEGIAIPVLLGDKRLVNKLSKASNLNIDDIEFIDNTTKEYEDKRHEFADLLYSKRQRRGVSLKEAQRLMFNRNYFGVAMVEVGMADAMIAGTKTKYADAMKPALQIINKKSDIGKIAGMYIMNTKKGPYFFADTTVNVDPTEQDLVDITLLTAKAVKEFGIDPVMAMLSYSNFGSSQVGSSTKITATVKRLHEEYPDLMVDGEMQANFALNKQMRIERYPFSKLGNRDVNTLIFPTLAAGNIAYKMMQEIGHAEAIGPIVMGLNKPIHVLQLSSTVREIVDMTAIAVVDAQTHNL